MRLQLRALFAIASQSFFSWIRARILYNIFFVSIFLLFSGYLASLLVFGHQERVMLHFGMFVNALSVFGVAISAGVRAIRAEAEERTAYLTLSRPVSRATYYFGKWFGIACFTALNLALLTGVLLVGLHFTGGAASFALFQGVVLLFVETLLVSAVAIFFSLLLRQGLAAMSTVAFAFLSHNHEQFRFLQEKSLEGGGGAPWVSLFSALTPDAQAFLMDTRIYYGQPLEPRDWVLRCAYGIGWALMFILVGNALFFRKNL